MYGHPGKKLLFMGCEFAQRREWNYEASLDWHLLKEPVHLGVQSLVRDLNRLYAAEPSLYERDYDHSGFQWIDCTDYEQSVVSFLRRADDPADHLVFVLNLTPVPRQLYRVGVPHGGRYRERLNTDAHEYGGSGVGNSGVVQADAVPSHGFDRSVVLTVPPLACLVLKPE
jgi:1,4-alpha-glucan branching enzyme